MDIHRKDLDGARGVPNRRGAWTTIGLRLDPAARGRNWPTVSPPGGWDTGWEDFIANPCHAMFGFKKPSWYYLPHFGAVAEATRSLPEARRRFRDGELRPGGQLMVRYKVPDDGFRWAYADCLDEVLKVTSGYRIALTYNLLVHGDTSRPVCRC